MVSAARKRHYRAAELLADLVESGRRDALRERVKALNRGDIDEARWLDRCWVAYHQCELPALQLRLEFCADEIDDDEQ